MVLLPGTRTLVDVERAPADVALLSFQRQLATIKSSFDAVVIDTPPALGLRMTASLMAADHVVCPIELEEYSMDGVTDMLKTVFGVRQRHNPALRLLGLVANRFNPHSIRQRDAMERLFRDYAAYVVPAKISTRSAIPEALAFGQPVWRMTKSSAREAAAEVFTVFEHLHRRMVDCTEEAV
jgi:chromosome partitioning protein